MKNAKKRTHKKIIKKTQHTVALTTTTAAATTNTQARHKESERQRRVVSRLCRQLRQRRQVFFLPLLRVVFVYLRDEFTTTAAAAATVAAAAGTCQTCFVVVLTARAALAWLSSLLCRCYLSPTLTEFKVVAAAQCFNLEITNCVSLSVCLSVSSGYFKGFCICVVSLALAHLHTRGTRLLSGALIELVWQGSNGNGNRVTETRMTLRVGAKKGGRNSVSWFQGDTHALNLKNVVCRKIEFFVFVVEFSSPYLKLVYAPCLLNNK